MSTKQVSVITHVIAALYKQPFSHQPPETYNYSFNSDCFEAQTLEAPSIDANFTITLI